MHLIEKIFILKSIVPFDVLSDREIIIVANMIKIKTYKVGEIIYHHESILKNLYIIAKGRVKMGEREMLKPYFGLEMLRNKIITETVFASTEVSIFMLSQEHILTLLYESPQLMMGFLHSQELEIDAIKI
jgi:CRP-like cAMP-binding protein